MPQLIFMKATSHELSDYMLRDLEKLPNVTVVNKILPFSRKLNRLIGDGATRFLNVPILQFCYSVFISILNPFKNIPVGSEPTYILFQNISSREVTPSYLKRFLKKHPNCIPVMLFTDPIDNYMSRYAKRLTEKIPAFHCMTYDPADAQRYGYHYTINIYSANELESVTPQYDIYFSFTGVNRLSTVQAVTDCFLKEQVNANIIIAGEPALAQYIKEHSRGIQFLKSRKTYPEVLKDVSASNCLLEVLQEGHTGATLRYYEAVCYNKRLLTNNKNIVNLPFYNPNYMKVFEKPQDIDCEWLKSHEPVSYGYDGRFSPIHLLEEMEKLTQNN